MASSTTSPVSTNPSSTNGQGTDNNPMVVIVPLLLLLQSMHFVFARLLAPYITPDSGALYVLAIATVIFGLYAVVTRRIDLQILRQHFWFFLAIGVLIGVSTNLNYAAVVYIDAGTASMLNKLSTLFGVLFGVLWLREQFSQNQWVGATLALLGVFTIAFQPGDYLRLGALIIICSSLMYALHAALVKRHGDEIDFVNFFFFRLATTTATLLLLAVGRGHLVWPTGIAWLLLTITGVVDVILSRLCYYWALRQMTMSVHSLILTVSPVLAILWSYLLIGDLPTVQQWVGGSAVVLGVLLVMRGQQNN